MYCRNRKFVLSVGVLLLAWAVNLSPNWCQAATILGSAIKLSELNDNPTATVPVGDKLFSNFMYTFTGEMPGPESVNVIPIQDDDGNYGIRFQAFFTDLSSTIGGSDALITYNVEATDPRFLISDAHLAGNPSLPGPQGLVSVTETFLPLGTNGEYTMSIYAEDDSPPPKLTDVKYFHPAVRSLSVQKDIGVYDFAGVPAPTLSFVDQTFSQIEVPEVSTAILAFIAVVTLVPFIRSGRQGKG